MSDNQALNTFDGLDYEEIEQAVMETSRGRWFLTEFARRHKAADTAVLLDAIRRLESQIQPMSADAPASPDVEPPRGHTDLPAVDAQAAERDSEFAGYDEIADKLDRTTQLVRRLRSSHKLIGEAADKSQTASKSFSVKSPPAVPDGVAPGFVGSDDDIFADNNSIASTLQQQADAATAGPDADTSPASGDTLNFTDLDDTDDTAQCNAANAGDDKVPDHAEQPAGEPVAADTSAAPIKKHAAETPKKRIIVIRRPADHPGDIPLAEGINDMSGDGPAAA